MALLKVFSHSNHIASLELIEGNEYIIGRQSDVDLVLRDTTLSRKHLRVFYDMHWQVEVLSKYSELEFDGEKLKHLDLDSDKEFLIQSYQFVFVMQEEAEQDPAANFEEAESPSAAIDDNAYANADVINDDDTNVDSLEVSPYVNISNDLDDFEPKKLNGKEWCIGRSAECEIQIEDKQASRKHCMITRNHHEFFVRDLGSSNGTFLNEKKMKPNKIAPLVSGDVIQIGKHSITFELINEEIAKEIQKFPEAVAPPNPFAVPNPSVNIPTNHGNAAAIRVDNKLKTNNQLNDKKKLIYAAIATVVILAAMFYKPTDTTSKVSKDPGQSEAKQSAFEALSTENQQLVLRFYDNAYRYYIQGDYQKSLNETQKIHRLLPEEGYLDLSVDKDSKKLEKLAKAAIKIQAEKDEIRRMQEEQRKLKEQVAAMVDYCDKQAKPGTSVEQAHNCLAKVYELDPENVGAKRIIQRLEQEAEQRMQAQRNRAAYQQQVNKGKNLFNRALQLEKKDKILDAISAYDRHLASSYPDPSNLKKTSAAKKKKLSINLKKRVDTLTRRAEADYEAKNFRGSIMNLNKALQLDPSTQEAKDLLAKVTRELNKDMKSLYSDSVLEESLGNIETAKSLWKKIKDTDVPSGNYYQKAKSKLKKYGD
tara:strand:- start:8337 stop:10280 length:1944 start_codon:yes stop_codon:yes gene_type:complete